MKHITPQQQLWQLIPASQQGFISTCFRRLKHRDQEDLCYAMIAYLRFGIVRNFTCPFMQAIYQLFIDHLSTV